MRRIRTVDWMILLLSLGLGGCSAAKRLGMNMIHQTPPPAPRALEDLAYRTDPRADPSKHRLDLFLPAESSTPFPMMVFVHGGGFVKGDKDFEAGGVEVYGDLGRYYVSRGIGVAVISYRLQPGVDWVAQVDDVAHAIRWVKDQAPSHGASDVMVLAGHSAGAWLVGRVALDSAVIQKHDLGGVIDAVIAVSGGGYDLADEETWEMGADVDQSEGFFRLDTADTDWQRHASLVPLITVGAPPFLLIHTHDEWRSVARQNRLLQAALQVAGVQATVIEVRGGSHARMVLRLSEPDRVSAEVETFIRSLPSVAVP